MERKNEIQKEKVKEYAPWRRKLHTIIFGYHTWGGKFFDLALLIAILLSVLMIMLESVAAINDQYGTTIRVIELTFTAIFTLEYVARIISHPKPIKYVLSFMGIIDLISILPTYLMLLSIGTSSFAILRSIRLIRVFRILKLTRYMFGAKELQSALWNSRHKIVVFLGSVLCIVVVMGTLLYMVEGEEHGFTSIPTSIYWAIVTLTTVGYGDIAPETVLGQGIASAIMILGYAILAVPTGIVTGEIVNEQRRNGMHKCQRCLSVTTRDDANYCFKCGERLKTSS